MHITRHSATPDSPGHQKPGIFRRALAYLDKHLGVIFLLPGILVLLVILTYPVVTNIWMSFTDAHLVYRDAMWVGLENYVFTFRDPDFYGALRRSIVWTAGSLTLQLLIGLGAALLLNLRIPGQTFFRLAMIIPYAFPPITIALIWSWMLNSLYGAINYFLMALGVIESPVAWLGRTDLAMATAIFVNTWFGFPLFALGILAGLQAIPADYYEVAKLEGASALQTFWHVTLPCIQKILGILIVLRTIWVFNAFDIVYLLTGGGPRKATQTLPIYAYQIGWQQGFISQTAAIAVLLFFILGVLAFIYFRIFRIEEEV